MIVGQQWKARTNMHHFLLLIFCAHLMSAIAFEECKSSGDRVCKDKCLNAEEFKSKVASFGDDETILPTLRGTIDNLISQDDISILVDSLPMSEFVESKGYDVNNNRDGRAYNSPIAYAGIGLQELRTSQEDRYNKLLEIREKVRLATEKALGICPQTLLVDFTTISQKIEGGAHRAHADNCLHYFDEKTQKATCDSTRTHPYPNRVAASILYLNNPDNFSDGQFYFANQSSGKVDETIPIQAGKMIYFTSGVENLHGALPVRERQHGDIDKPPRRLALAMWYVTDKELEEYVPPFQESNEESSASSSNTQSTTKPRKVYDPNDPDAPKELFTIPIPNNIDVSEMLQTVGAHLASPKTNNGSWKINMYGEDTLHVLFTRDNSAMFSVEFGVELDVESDYTDYSIVVERHTDGRKPASLQYRLQESVMLHNVLDAILLITTTELSANKEKEQKYFNSQVEMARSTLIARQA